MSEEQIAALIALLKEMLWRLYDRDALTWDDLNEMLELIDKVEGA